VTAAGITTPAIWIEISGSGDVTIDGAAGSQAVTLSGSGDYGAGNLISRNASAEISGSSDVTVNALDSRDAEISGSGKATYTGNPQVRQTISGSGVVSPLGGKKSPATKPHICGLHGSPFSAAR
jgi:hypothetical protein